MRSITTLQHPEKTSLNSPLGSIEVPLFDLTAYEKPSKALHHYDLDHEEVDDDRLKRYKPCQHLNTSNSSVVSAASASPLGGGTAIASSQPATATSTEMRAPFISPTSPTWQSTETSVPTSLTSENSTLLPAGSPALEPVEREVVPDSTISNPLSGGKGCESCAKSVPAISSGSNLWELSNEDYAKSLEEAEWQDILVGLSESLPQNLGLATGAIASSLLIPTLTTGSGSYRDAGQTKCEQRLKQLGVIPNGCQFSPEGMAALMGFPLDWFAALTGERLRGMSTVLTTDSPNVPTCDDSLGDASPPLKLELLSPLPCSEGELLSNVENDSVRNSTPVLSESFNAPVCRPLDENRRPLSVGGDHPETSVNSVGGRPTRHPLSNAGSSCRSCGQPIYWGKTAGDKNCPFNLDGTSHFTTCPDANRWSRKVERDEALTSSQNGVSSSLNCPESQPVLLPDDSLLISSANLSESISPELGSETEFSQPFGEPKSPENSQQSSPNHEEESSHRSREKLLELADSLSEEGLRELVRAISESLGNGAMEEITRVLDESSFDKTVASPQPSVSLSARSLPDVGAVVERGSRIATRIPAAAPTDSTGGGARELENALNHSDHESLPPPEEKSEKEQSRQRAEPALTSSSVATYTPGGQARGGNEYFRLTWWENGKSRHKHIRGGNTRKPSVLSRVRQIIEAIAARLSFSEVLALC